MPASHEPTDSATETTKKTHVASSSDKPVEGDRLDAGEALKDSAGLEI